MSATTTNEHAASELPTAVYESEAAASEAPNPALPDARLGQLYKSKEGVPQQDAKFETDLERYKIKVELFKWLIGTVGLTLITYIINWGFKDREQGMQEISQYDKYATELIILNDNPVRKRMLAQFFAYVTPSHKLKDGWERYYKDVNLEYQAFLKEEKAEQERLRQLTALDTSRLSESKKEEIKVLEQQLEQKREIRNAPMRLPLPSVELTAGSVVVPSEHFVQTSQVSSSADRARFYENEGFGLLLNKDVDGAIKSFTQSENSLNGYNMVYDIAVYLRGQKGKLITGDENAYKELYRNILDKYSWNLPEQYKKELKERIK